MPEPEIQTLQMGWLPTLGGGAMRLVDQSNNDNMLVVQPMMVEELGAKYEFSWVYDPPADGEWGAKQEDGNMSGLIGQAGTFLTSPHLSSHFLTHTYLNYPYRTFPHMTFPYLTFPYHTFT